MNSRKFSTVDPMSTFFGFSESLERDHSPKLIIDHTLVMSCAVVNNPPPPHTHTQSALNIIPLTPGLTEVKKISHNQFNVNLIGSNRVFNFRALASGGKSSQRNRDEWCEVCYCLCN